VRESDRQLNALEISVGQNGTPSRRLILHPNRFEQVKRLVSIQAGRQ
jgi:hypothetical protein